jgi:hypothetical protein
MPAGAASSYRHHSQSEIEVAATEHEQLALPKAGQARSEDECSISVRDGVGQLQDLGHRGEAVLGVPLGSTPSSWPGRSSSR